MEKINKNITKKCNICYLAGIEEGIEQEQKRIIEFIRLLKDGRLADLTQDNQNDILPCPKGQGISRS